MKYSIQKNSLPHRLFGFRIGLALLGFSLLSCTVAKKDLSSNSDLGGKPESYYGTLVPFASEAVYFLMTDRFVNGDTSNDQVHQGGDNPTYLLPIKSDDGQVAYVGYMGGDFKGILDNASYIRDMGFTSIWLTPIVDQPDESFTGGEKINFGGAFKDGGKTGYHGYWGDNFYLVDEHLPSKDLSFKILTEKLRQQYGIKTVLDIVANHGSPAYSMTPVKQPKFGQLFDKDWKLLADQQNLPPEKLNPNNPLHQFYNSKPDIMQLSDLNENNPAVLDYFVGAYSHWIDQGADAFRIDTIKHMPHSFWKKFSDKIRENHPDFFMFAESYSFDANFIAEHTYPKNGGVSVLDFPGRKSMIKVFENAESDFSVLEPYLHLTGGPYQNPYELMTFYDNHDMARMNADENGFIDANNWLFTSRGIPVVYYGSEIGFMAGKAEHQGNRNYFGKENIKKAKDSSIYQSLKEIAGLRKQLVSLQRGLQVNISLSGNKAAFYRVYENQGIYQTALILLNKGNQQTEFNISNYLSPGEWINQQSDKTINVNTSGKIKEILAPHSASVYVLNKRNTNQEMIEQLKKLMVSSN